MKTLKNNDPLQGNFDRSERLLSKSDTNVPDKGRKSLKTNEKGLNGEVKPASHLLSVNPFIRLVMCYDSFRMHVKGLVGDSSARTVYATDGRHTRSLSLTHDLFMILCYCGCVGRAGFSVKGLCLFLYNSYGTSNVRNVYNKIRTLVNMKLLINVKGRYCLSVHAEKLFLKNIGRDEFRSMNRLAKLLSV